MNLTDLEHLRLMDDNVLVCMDLHARARHPEEISKGGIVLPKSRNAVASNEGVLATVLSTGPGHWHDKWYDQERGHSQDGSSMFVKMNPDLQRGTRVIVDHHYQGNPIWGDDNIECRIIREFNILAIVEEDEE